MNRLLSLAKFPTYVKNVLVRLMSFPKCFQDVRCCEEVQMELHGAIDPCARWEFLFLVCLDPTAGFNSRCLCLTKILFLQNIAFQKSQIINTVEF